MNEQKIYKSNKPFETTCIKTNKDGDFIQEKNRMSLNSNISLALYISVGVGPILTQILVLLYIYK